MPNKNISIDVRYTDDFKDMDKVKIDYQLPNKFELSQVESDIQQCAYSAVERLIHSMRIEAKNDER